MHSVGGSIFYLGSIFAYAHTGKLLYRVDGIKDTFGFLGKSIAKVGDVDGDGCDDFVAGADTPLNMSPRGAALVYSGRTGKVLTIAYGELPNDRISYAVAGIGDIDGDGIPDIAASSGGGFGTRGVVSAFSGKDGHLLRSWTGSPPNAFNGFGSEITGGVDLDLDGVLDLMLLAVSEPTSKPNIFGIARVISGRDGTPIFDIEPSPGGNGSFAAGDIGFMGKIAGSPFPLFIVFEGYYGFSAPTGDLGRIRVFKGPPGGVQAFGTPCPGTLAAAPLFGIRSMQDRVRLHLSGAPPNAPALLVVGLSRSSFGGAALPYPLDAIGFPGCALYTSVDVFAWLHTGSTGNDHGYAFADLALPLAVGPGRFTLHGQWLALQPGTAGLGGTHRGTAMAALKLHPPDSVGGTLFHSPPGSLVFRAPSQPYAPRGYYLMFLVTNTGVPSVGQFVLL